METTPWTSAYSRSPDRTAQSEDLHRGSEIDDVHVGVGDGDGRSEHRELHSAHPGDVADGAVGDHAFAVEGLQNRGVHLANGRGAAGGCVQILEDGNPRHRQQADRLPPIRAVDVGVTRHRRVRGPHPAGGRIAEKARRAPGHAPQAGTGKALVAQANPEMLDGVGDGAGIELPDGIESRRWQWCRGSRGGCRVVVRVRDSHLRGRTAQLRFRKTLPGTNATLVVGPGRIPGIE